jgi:hypothetical protein
MRFVTRSLLSLIAIATTTAVAACSSDLALPSDPGEGGFTSSGDQSPGSQVEFQMRVLSVDPGAGRLTLSNGTVVRVTATTVISPQGDLLTIESAAAAVEQGRPVRAEGRGSVDSASPGVIVASTLKIEVDD